MAGALPPAPVTVENTAGPPDAGLFMADKDYLFYKPSTASASPPTDAVIGGQEVLLQADGVLGHSWVNLSFAYSSWNIVNEGGYVPSQSAMVSGEPLGAVRVQNSSQVTFSGCDIRHIGGPWALSVSGASSKCVPLRDTWYLPLTGTMMSRARFDLVSCMLCTCQNVCVPANICV